MGELKTHTQNGFCSHSPASAQKQQSLKGWAGLKLLIDLSGNIKFKKIKVIIYKNCNRKK
jgi:hypothetical protein